MLLSPSEHNRGARDHVARQLGQLLLGEVGSRPEVVVDQRVIHGQQIHLAVAHPVAAGVAHVRHVGGAVLVDHVDRHHGGAHALVFVAAQRLLVDAGVGHLDRGDQAVHRKRKIGIEVERPGDILFFGGRKELVDRLDRHLRGHVSGPVTAHAVGDHEEVVLGHQPEAVLVVLALTAHIGQTGDPQEFGHALAFVDHPAFA
jgi:hypothetical protein